MSRLMLPLAVFGLLVCSVVSAKEKETESKGLQVGEKLDAFYVTKVAGADDDGVEKGQRLCYRCKYGSRPMVLVFARDTGGNVGELVKEINAAVKANEEADLKGLVTLLGEDDAKLKESAVKVSESNGGSLIPVVVATDHVTGPSSYKIDEKAAVTVVLASEGEVVMSR